MKITIDFSSLKKITRTQISVATVAVVIAIGGYIAWDRHQYNEAKVACDEAREVRSNARKFIYNTTMSGMGDLAIEGSSIMERADEAVKRCIAKGF